MRLNTKIHKQNIETYWVGHKVSPCWRNEITTGCRKNPHQLLQGFELKKKEKNVRTNLKV